MNRVVRASLVCVVIIVAAGAVHGETVVQGTITTTTWSKVNSPYRVTGAITVPANNMLTIEPGVDVLFDADVPFAVMGSLIAVGAPDDSVRFLRGTASAWRGIVVSGSDSSVIDRARISGGSVSGPPYSWEAEGVVLVTGARIRIARSWLKNVGTSIGAKAASRVEIDSVRFLGPARAIAVGNGAAMSIARSTFSGHRATDRGAAITASGTCRLAIRGCDFTGNRVTSTSERVYGGAVNLNDGVSAEFDSCRFASNNADIAHYGEGGAIYARECSTLVVRRCTFTGNTALYGGAVSSGIGTPTVVDGCVFTGNRAGKSSGALQLNYAASARVERCTIVANAAGDYAAGAVLTGQNLVLANCLIARNTSAKGANVIVETDAAGSAAMTNCTIADNDGGGFTAGGERVDVLGSIFRGNAFAGAPADIGEFPGGVRAPILARYSDIGPTPWPGQGNITADPLFVDTLSYALSPGSPCIDAGAPWILDADGGRSDMGHTGGGNIRDAPRIETSVPELAFAAADTPETLVIHNAGRGDLVVSRIEIPPDFVLTAPLPATIPPSDSIVVSIACTGARTIFRDQATIVSSDTSVDSVFVALRAFFGAVSGTWTSAESPYSVTGPISVPASDTLAIEPGVTVAFDPRGSLAVSGRLAAHGAGSREIRFWPTGNSPWGGVAVTGTDSVTIVHAEIVGAKRSGAGGAITILADAPVNIRNCVIRANYSEAGGAIAATAGRLRIERCLLTRNDADMSPSAILLDGTARADFVNCTIAENYGPDGDPLPAGILVGPDASAVFMNCIVVSNGEEEIVAQGSVTANYSDIYQGTGTAWPGSGNIATYPSFAETRTFALAPGSPLVNAGAPNILDIDGSRSDMGWTGGGGAVLVSIAPVTRPHVFSLSQNAPNPFNPSTAIRYSLAQPGKTRLAIYDANGRLVRVLVDEARTAGVYEVVWDGTDAAGRSCASGVYVYRLVAKDGTIVRRMTMVR